MRNRTHLHMLASVGRDNLLPASEIPTAREATRMYYDWQESRGHKSLKDIKSVIGGRPLSRRSGVQPKAGPFGEHFGATPMHRITTEDVVRWFATRIPTDSSPSFRKKAKSFLGVFLAFCHSQRWIPATVLVAADEMESGHMTADRRWLTPEQLCIFDAVVAESESIQAYEAFVWKTYRDTGIRTFEGPQLVPASLELDRGPGRLHVEHGKGSGAGKPRFIDVADSYVDEFLRHVNRHSLRPGQPVLFQRRWLLLKGEKDVMGWVPDHNAKTTSKAVNGVFRRIQNGVNERVARGDISSRAVPRWKLNAKVMRKTFACNQLILARLGLGGMDLEQLQDALGHASLTTTKVYLADVNDYLARSVARVGTGEAAQLILAEKHRREDRGAEVS
jgi:integrase